MSAYITAKYKSTERWVLFDDGFLEEFRAWKWALRYTHKSSKRFYAYTCRDGMTQTMHRLVMGCEKGDGKIVDHINGNSLDNRCSNLRIVNPWQNRWNLPNCPGSFEVKNQDKWGAEIKMLHKKIRLGYFKTEAEAKAAYQGACRVRWHFSVCPLERPESGTETEE